MRRRITFALLVAALLTLPAWRPAVCALGIRHGQKDAKREIEDLEQQWRTAQLSGDTALMDRLLSDDYVGIGMNGVVNTKTQQLDRFRRRAIALTRIDVSEVKVKMVGAVAIVTCLAQIEGTADGSSMSGMYRYTRVYQKLPSGIWKITNFEATRLMQGADRRSGTTAGPVLSKSNFTAGSERWQPAQP